MVDQVRPYRSGRRTTARVLVPVGVVALTAAGIGLVPAMAGDSGPSLPALTAEQVVAKALGSDTESLSGTVKVKADLGVPAQLLGGLPGAAGGRGGGDQGSSQAAPESKLLELLGGEHTLQVAVDGPDRQRIGLIGGLSGYELVHNGGELWAWDSRSNDAVHLTGPAAAVGQRPKTPLPVTPQDAARRFLALGADTTSVVVDGTAEVAGQKAYQLSVKPKQSGSTIAEVRIAVAADNGVPLAVLVRATDGSKVLDVHFSQVSFAKPSASTFAFTAPKGAKVTERRAEAPAVPTVPGLTTDGQKTDGHDAGGHNAGGHTTDGLDLVGQGWATVLTAKLPVGEGASFAKALGKPVGGGTLIGTKVLNVLITDDGRVFAGAVTPQVLQSAAGGK
ncbi:outer membrane lipoprotein carrier protein LolA [Kitasatospora sp. CMC57]|uniref:Outer membrane lipoprotein carrier protein LolA n=1 Tax=Kitasatospora sp. CMC57 TaxID=3231513 RepID=A0AB33JUP9_9ACTN